MAERRTDDDLRDRLDQMERRIAGQIDRLTTRTFALLSVLVVVFLAVGAWSVVLTSRGDQANHALCALRGDLERRIEQSRGFLVEHPEGVAGVSAKVIQDGINNQSRTVKALGGLSCG